MLFWAGLRGAIAFALSFGVESKAGPAIRTTTLFVCVISIMVLGGTTNYALSFLKIKTGFGQAGRPFKSTAEYFNEAEETDSSDDGESGPSDGGADFSGLYARRGSDASSFDHPMDDLALRQASAQKRNPNVSNWFTVLDEKYLKPFFSRQEWKYGERRTRPNQRRTRRSGSSPTRENLLISGSNRVFSSHPSQPSTRNESSKRGFTNPRQMDLGVVTGEESTDATDRKRQSSSGTLDSDTTTPTGSRDVSFMNSK
jgi:sodium/hydrogen exchanger-like protein 6/7